MLTLEIELLTGAYRAALPDGTAAEWPPHPERIFSALVQAWADGDHQPQERTALEWLERQDLPTIEASESFSDRDAWVVYVPPNDPRGSDLEALPAMRKRQARDFRAAIPTDPIVRLRWNEAPPEGIGLSLHALAQRIASIGHSSSLTRCAFMASTPQRLPLWIPHADGEVSLRVPYAGRLDDLERWFSSDGKATERPRTRRTAAYKIERPNEVAEPSVFGGRDDWFVFEDAGGFRPDLLAFPQVARIMRAALMKLAPEPVPEVLSGHGPGGGPSQRPHLTIAPLANVGWRHATGDLLGLAVILPRELDEKERRSVLRAIASFANIGVEGDSVGKLRLGPNEWQLALARHASRASLRPDRWCRASTTWASATPLLLDRFPDRGDPLEEVRLIATACRHIGLPEPVEVELLRESMVAAAPSAYPGRGRQAGWNMPTASRFASRPRRHVILRFDRKVEGPVILGAGRYYGMGLCLPIAEGEKE